MPDKPVRPPSVRQGRLIWLGFFLVLGALIYGPLALVVIGGEAKWRRDYVPPSCTDRARTLTTLRDSIEAEREGLIQCLRDASYCVGVYSQESLEAQKAREAHLAERYLEKCTAIPSGKGT